MPSWTFIQICGAIGVACAAWNLLGDLYFLDISTAALSSEEFGKILMDKKDGYLFHFNSDNWWVIFLAQSGGWMYPIWAFVTAVPLYMGLAPPSTQAKDISIWKTSAPCLLLVYGLCVVGGALHNAFAFLTALPSVYHFSGESWSGLAESQDFERFLEMAQTRIIQHIGVGTLPGYIACNVASLWIAFIVHFYPTRFPKWYNFFNPVVTIIWAQIVGKLLPQPWGFYFVGCLGTWGLLMLNIGTTYCLWDHHQTANAINKMIDGSALLQ